jgi:hypothetical protein
MALALHLKEDLMAGIQRLTELRNAGPSANTAGNWDWQRGVPPSEEPATARLHRRFNRDTGGCLGGIVLGAGGCLLGATMPYQDPVAVALSVLWWGVYLGCLGLSIGALVGAWVEQTPVPLRTSAVSGSVSARPTVVRVDSLSGESAGEQVTDLSTQPPPAQTIRPNA